MTMHEERRLEDQIEILNDRIALLENQGRRTAVALQGVVGQITGILDVLSKIFEAPKSGCDCPVPQAEVWAYNVGHLPAVFVGADGKVHKEGCPNAG